MKVKEALRDGIEAFTAPLLLMKEAHANAGKQPQPQPDVEVEPKRLDLVDERGSSDVETLGKMTAATGAVLAAGGMALELAGVERTLNMPLAMGVGGLAVGAAIYGAERILSR